MAIDMWNQLNIGLDFDQDESGSQLMIAIDHDEIKGEVAVDFKNLLEATLDETFEDAVDVETVEDVTIPEFEGMEQYLLECVSIIRHKIEEAKGFVKENS